MIIATAKWVDGDRFVSIFDFSTAMQENYPDSDATLDGNTVTVLYDAGPFHNLGDGWGWSAAVTEAGSDVYTCEPAAAA